MNHEIQLIGDDELPEGNHWALVETPHTIYFFVKRSRVSAEVLEEGWAAYRARTAPPEPVALIA